MLQSQILHLHHFRSVLHSSIRRFRSVASSRKASYSHQPRVSLYSDFYRYSCPRWPELERNFPDIYRGGSSQETTRHHYRQLPDELVHLSEPHVLKASLPACMIWRRETIQYHLCSNIQNFKKGGMSGIPTGSGPNGSDFSSSFANSMLNTATTTGSNERLPI